MASPQGQGLCAAEHARRTVMVCKKRSSYALNEISLHGEDNLVDSRKIVRFISASLSISCSPQAIITKPSSLIVASGFQVAQIAGCLVHVKAIPRSSPTLAGHLSPPFARASSVDWLWYWPPSRWGWKGPTWPARVNKLGRTILTLVYSLGSASALSRTTVLVRFLR